MFRKTVEEDQSGKLKDAYGCCDDGEGEQTKYYALAHWSRALLSSIIQAMDNNVNRDVRFTTRARPQSKF